MSEKTEQIQFDFMDTDNYVYKSNNLIESNYNLSINEQRLIYIAIKKLKPRFVKSNVKPSDLTTYASTQKFGDIRIYVNEFKKEFDLKSNSLYERLAELSDKLFEREFMYFSNDGQFVKKRWVITCKYNPNEKYISLTFHPDLILDLLIFKSKYGKLQYNVAKYLNTDYAFRLYELFKNALYKNERTMSIEEIKKKLDIAQDKYSRYSKFKSDVIDKSIKMINEYSDITVSAENIYLGRKVGSLKFDIREKEEVAVDLYCEKQDEEHIQNMINITNMPLNEIQVAKLTNASLEAIKNYNVDLGLYDYIKEKVGYIVEYSKTTSVGNYYGLLKYALDINWNPNITINKRQGHFNNFEQRQYDLSPNGKMERMLLGWDDED